MPSTLLWVDVSSHNKLAARAVKVAWARRADHLAMRAAVMAPSLEQRPFPMQARNKNMLILKNYPTLRWQLRFFLHIFSAFT